LRIVHNADSSSRFDHLDAALHSGSSEQRGVVPRQVADLFLREGDRPFNFLWQLLLRTIEAVRCRQLLPLPQIAYWSLETE
jgi:hypothetical protein